MAGIERTASYKLKAPLPLTLVTEEQTLDANAHGNMLGDELRVQVDRKLLERMLRDEDDISAEAFFEQVRAEWNAANTREVLRS
jgi:hypothetical protein